MYTPTTPTTTNAVVPNATVPEATASNTAAPKPPTTNRSQESTVKPSTSVQNTKSWAKSRVKGGVFYRLPNESDDQYLRALSGARRVDPNLIPYNDPRAAERIKQADEAYNRNMETKKLELEHQDMERVRSELSDKIRRGIELTPDEARIFFGRQI